jgi:hypothetical protein
MADDVKADYSSVGACWPRSGPCASPSNGFQPHGADQTSPFTNPSRGAHDTERSPPVSSYPVMNTRGLCRRGLLPVILVSSAACGSGATSPTPAPVPFRVIVAGEPFTATVFGQTVSTDSGIDEQAIPGEYEVSGAFSGQAVFVAFGRSTSAGGVKIGSLKIVEGPGSLPVGFSPYQDGCVAAWGGLGPRPQTFRVRFTVTTDAANACVPETGK